jgi:DNA mismatch repair protein MutS2
MTPTLAALEFDRVLLLVAHFTQTNRGRHQVLATPPRFEAGAGLRAFRLSTEVASLLERNGIVSLEGLDAAGLLDGPSDLGTGELSALVTLVRRIVETRSALEAAAPGGAQLSALRHALPRLDPLLAYCDQRLGPNGEILDSASAALARARAARERSRQAIVGTLEQVRRRHRGLTAPFTLRRDRYCVPVPAAERGTVPGLVLDSSGSGATLFVEPFEIVDLNNSLIESITVAREEEERILRELAATVGRRGDELIVAAALLAELDAAQARCRFGKTCGGVLLEPATGSTIRLVGARHPLLDPNLAGLRREVLGEEGNTRPIVPLDLDFPSDARLMLLSGPNAGGKTVALKTVGLAALMAQAGIPALCEEGSRLPPLSAVWCHIGDEQNVLSELSTFTAAMQATGRLLATADEDTLVLYDELGAGTDPEEGAALAAALLETLAARRCWAVATAHLVTVAARLEELPGAINASMGFDEERGTPTYALRLGLPGRSRALAIASRSGVPAGVIARAHEMLSRGFLTIDTYLEKLQREQEALASERLALVERQEDARRSRQAAEEERRRLAEETRRARETLAGERESLRRRARERLEAALAELERAREAGELPGKKRIATIRRAAAPPDDDLPRTAPGGLAIGRLVRLRGSSTEGVVERIDGDRVELAAGDKRLWIDAASCEAAEPGERAARAAVTVEGTSGATASEVKLLGMTQEEAREELERFLDRAMLAGIRHVRVVHGHGSGTLRRLVREVLTEHPGVASFHHPPQARGGTGATEADLE